MDQGMILIKDEAGDDIGFIFKFNNGVGPAWGFQVTDGINEGPKNELAHVSQVAAEKALRRVANGEPEYVRRVPR